MTASKCTQGLAICSEGGLRPDGQLYLYRLCTLPSVVYRSRTLWMTVPITITVMHHIS
jgi:hypothetical protein